MLGPNLATQAVMTEEELIAHAIQGDLDCFNQLIRTHQNQAFNVAYRIMADEAAAADATQEAVITIYRKIDTFRGGSFKSWFLRIVTNTCLDELRRQRRRPTVPLEAESEDGEAIEDGKWMEDDAAGPEEQLSDSEMEMAIQNCLSDLDDKFRVVLVMVDIGGENYEAVAAAIGRPVGTVKSRLARGRLKMQECLQGLGELLPGKFRQSHEESSHDQAR